MNFTYIGKDSGSGDTGCSAIAQVDQPASRAIATTHPPSRYENDPCGGYVVIGVKLTDAERASITEAFTTEGVTIADHEDLVWIPGNVVELAIERGTLPT